MFNLSNLNPYEFELLCKDIMEEKLNKPLYNFPEGPDQGIDITDSKINHKVIIQAKHYAKSSTSKLLSDLKKECDKIDILNPKEYYICTSKELTDINKKAIYDLFSDYMIDYNNTIDGIEINDFLSRDENIDIVKKNYKLWLCSSNILDLLYNGNVFIDCYELLDEINRDIELFVETKSFNKTKKILDKHNVVVIIGSPGVGKSIISKMLLLKYANEGYSVRYSSDNNISDLKKVIASNNEKKEILLLDDFLGQHYLKLEEKQPNELKTLISYVKRTPNKKLVLNSRITIMNEAKMFSLTFDTLMDDNINSQYIIDLDKMTSLDKAQILYNHLYHYGIPEQYFNNIRENSRYMSIINHKNYNPRIIEYVTKKRFYEKIEPEKYFQSIMQKLDSPTDVWRDEFRNRLSEEDRIFMNTLYSLTNLNIPQNILEESFCSRINDKNIDTSKNVFNDILSRLNDSLVKLVRDSNGIVIGALNPSINDYLRNDLSNNNAEIIDIINKAEYVEQIDKFIDNEVAKPYIIEKLISGNLLNLKTINLTKYYYYLKLILHYKLFDLKVKSFIELCIAQLATQMEHNNYYLSAIASGITKVDFVEFYSLQKALLKNNAIVNICKKVYYSYIYSISNSLVKVYKDDDRLIDYYNKLLSEFSLVIISALEEDFEEFASDRFTELVKEYFNENYYSFTEEELQYGNEPYDEDDIIENLKSQLLEDLSEYIKKEIFKYDDCFDISINTFDEYYIVCDVDYSQIIYDIAQEYIEDNEDDDNDENSELIVIKELFEYK